MFKLVFSVIINNNKVAEFYGLQDTLSYVSLYDHNHTDESYEFRIEKDVISMRALLYDDVLYDV